MKELDSDGRRLLAYLVGKLPFAVENDPRTFVTYKQVHDELRLPVRGPFGASLKSQGLVSLAEWAFASAKPGITGLIVDQSTREPGEGYFKLLGWKSNPYQRWADEIRRSKNFDWTEFLGRNEAGSSEGSQQLLLDVSFRSANVWRLVAHHQDVDLAVAEMTSRGVLAVGWTKVGSLDDLAPANQTEISSAISAAYPELKNAQLGGPSLWNLYRELKAGDLVIVGGDSRRNVVMEVIGDYFFSEDQLLGYAHLRAATATAIDPDALWEAVGGAVDSGQNIRWALARLASSAVSRRLVYEEGTRFEVRSTAIERNPAARLACLEHYGRACFTCGFEFRHAFGDLGDGYIHVHHRTDIAFSRGVHVVDPVTDLVPLCPNCHAMVHRERPAIKVEYLKRLIEMRWKDSSS